MKILVACEESQTVAKAFRSQGVEAYSCDVLPCSGGHPEWHIQDDVVKLLAFSWDMIIAFPPCTYLSRAGSHRLYPGGQLNQERYEKGLEARAFFMEFYNADCPRIAIENPVSNLVYQMPKHSQLIQPYMFGHAYTKATRLWLKGLPILMATDLVVPERSFTHQKKGGKARSKTFPGVAAAMASQWGSLG